LFRDVTSLNWSDEVDDVLAGDQVVMLASVTPAKGVVLAPVTNFGTRDRAAGTIAINTSVGAGRKLQRIARNPHVALAFHTRAHGDSARPAYVLVQGRAALSEPIADYPDTLGERWDRRADPRPRSGLWRRWMRVYHLRVEIRVTVERIVTWPDLACDGPPAVLGRPLPEAPPPPQPPPRKGTGPRVSARGVRRLPHRLLGWVDADGWPMVVPVAVESDGRVRGPEGFPPAGGRRAGLTAHWFTRRVLGQRQIVMTGWLADGRYAPHTRTGYFMPPSKTLYRIAVGLATRRRARADEARRDP
jgi:general stress protein 26